MTSLLDVASQTQAIIAQFFVEPLLILFLGIFAGTLLEQAIVFAARELKKDTPSTRFSARVAAWIVYIIAAGFSLHAIGVLFIILWFLAGVVVVVVTISALLSLRDFFPNALRYQTVARKLKPGTTISTRLGDLTVIRVHIADTAFRTTNGDIVYWPNQSVPLQKKS